MHCTGGVCPGGCLFGGVSDLGVCLPRVGLPGTGVSTQGGGEVCVSQYVMGQTPPSPVERQTPVKT